MSIGEEVLGRLQATEDRVLAAVAKAPEGIAKELGDLRSRVAEARAQFDSSAEGVREKLVSGQMSEDEFRARLVMLEMEYSSRTRLAEDGLQILSEKLEDHASDGRAWVQSVIDDVRDALRLNERREKGEADAAASERERLLADTEHLVGQLRIQLKQARERVRELERENESARGLREKLRGAERERERIEKGFQEELREVVSRLLEEKASLASRLKTAQEYAKSAREQAEAGVDQVAATAEKKVADKIAGLEATVEKAKASLASAEADQAARTARLEKELEQARRRASEAEASVEVMSETGQSASAELKKLRLEHSGMLDRLNQAESERDSLRKTLDAERAGSGRKADERAAAAEQRAAQLSDDLTSARDEIDSLRGGLADRPAQDETAGESAAAAEKISELQSKLRAAREEAEQAREALAREKASGKRLRKSLFEADTARDQALAKSRDGWSEEKERYEDILADQNRQITTLRTTLESERRELQETLAKQDASRMQEIFKLRADIQKLKWRLEGDEKL